MRTCTLTLLAAAAFVPAVTTARPARAPAPTEPVPARPAPLARALVGTTSRLRAAIERWRTRNDLSRGGPPARVALLALYEQRIYRRLVSERRLARTTIVRLPRSLAQEARANVVAGRELAALSQPRPLSVIRTGRPPPVGVLLRYYAEAQRRFHVAWHVLAAVNFVESAFGKLRNASAAGAQGPMQFMPSTWRKYGLDGDVHDPHDAILGAANYLHASGAPRDYRRALYAYNRSPAYVDAILRYAARIARDRRAYFAYYSWQVFVRTPSGVRRVTAFGLGGRPHNS